MIGYFQDLTRMKNNIPMDCDRVNTVGIPTGFELLGEPVCDPASRTMVFQAGRADCNAVHRPRGM